jgi:hypothetical protein
MSETVALADRLRAKFPNVPRTCGECSLCCKLPYIAELSKSIDTWCKHAAPGCGGCRIYPDRPRECRGFVCGWLSGNEAGLDDKWFPARCKMIVAPRVSGYAIADQGMLVTVDPDFPNAWRKEPYYSQLLEWAQLFSVEIRIGLRCIGLNADGSENEVRRSQAHIEGRIPDAGTVRGPQTKHNQEMPATQVFPATSTG